MKTKKQSELHEKSKVTIEHAQNASPESCEGELVNQREPFLYSVREEELPDGHLSVDDPPKYGKYPPDE